MPSAARPASGWAAGSHRAAAAAVYGSILPAVWSFQLALRSRGLGSAFTTLHLYREVLKSLFH